MGCGFTYKGKDYPSKDMAEKAYNADKIKVAGVDKLEFTSRMMYRMWERDLIRWELGKVTNIGANSNQADQAMVVFDKIASTWAKKHGKNKLDFYGDGMLDLVTVDQGFINQDKNAKGRINKKDKGGYLIELFTDKADISTVMHELAHVFTELLTEKERNQIAQDFTGRKDALWSDNSIDKRSLHEYVAVQFELYLAGHDTTMEDGVMEEVIIYLKNSYSGVINRLSQTGAHGQRLSVGMMRIYDRLLEIEEGTFHAENFSDVDNDPVWKQFEQEGKKTSQATAMELQERLADWAAGWKGEEARVYFKSSIASMAEAASTSKLLHPDNAHAAAVEMLAEYARTKETTGVGSAPTDAIDGIAMTFAATELEKGIDRMTHRISATPGPQRAELLQQRDMMMGKLDTITRSILLQRSMAGLTLGMGAHLVKRVWYSYENMVNIFASTSQTQPNKAEKRELRDLASQMQAKNDKIINLKQNEDALTEEQKDLHAKQTVEKMYKMPLYKKYINKFGGKSNKKQTNKESTRAKALAFFKKKSKERKKAADTELLQSADDLSSEVDEESEFLRFAVFDLIEDKSVPTDDFMQLIHSFLDSDYGKAMEADKIEDIQDMIRDVIVSISPITQGKHAQRLAEDKESISAELHVIDRFQEYLTRVFVPRGRTDVIQSDAVNTLNDFHDQLMLTVAMDDTINHASRTRSVELLETLRDMYSKLSVTNPHGGPNFDLKNKDISIDTLVAAIDAFKQSRSVEKKKQKIQDLEGVMDELKQGLYGGNLRGLVSRYDADLMMDNLSSMETKGEALGKIKEFKEFKQAALQKKMMEEVFKTLSNRTNNTGGFNEMAVLTAKRLNSLGSKNIDGSKITGKDVANSLVGQMEKKPLLRSLRARITNMKEEGRAMKELEGLMSRVFANEEGEDVDPTDISTKNAQDIRELIRQIYKLSKIDYITYGIDTGPQSKAINNVMEMFSDTIDIDKPGNFTLENIIEQIRLYERARGIETYTKKGEQYEEDYKRLKATKVEDLSIDDFKYLPEVLPKFLDERIEPLRTLAARNYKGIRNTLKKKLLEEHLKNIKEGNPDLVGLKRLLQIDNDSDEGTKIIEKETQGLIQLTSKFREYLSEKMKSSEDAWVRTFFNAPRVAVLAGDISFVPYQGGFVIPFLLKHWKLGGAAFSNLFGGIFREFASTRLGKKGLASDHFNKVQAHLKNDPYWDDAVTSGLILVDPTNMAIEEELQLTNLIETHMHLLLGNFVGGGIENYFKSIRKFSERSYSNYMNTIRLGMYKHGVKAANLDGLSNEASYKAKAEWAEYVNTMSGTARVFTGREKTDRDINTILTKSSGPFIAPRLYASTFQALMNTYLISDAYNAIADRKRWDKIRNKVKGVKPIQDPKSAYEIEHGKSEHEAVKKQILKNNVNSFMMYSMYYVGLYAVNYGIANNLIGALTGDDDDQEALKEKFTEIWQTNLNPYNSKFLKIDIGNRTFMATPASTYIRVAARVWGMLNLTGDYPLRDLFGWETSDNMDQTSWLSHIGGFIEPRVSPTISAVVTNFAMNKDFMGRKISDTLHGRAGHALKNMSTMIWMQGILENSIDGAPIGDTAVEAFADMVGINTYRGNPFYNYWVKKYKADPAYSNTRWTASYGISAGDPLKDTDDETKIKDRAQENFGYWLQDKLKQKSHPAPHIMTNRFNSYMNESLRYYGYSTNRYKWKYRDPK